MLPPAVTMTPAAARDVDAVVAQQLLFDRADERAAAGAVLIAVRVGIRQRRARDVDRRGRRPVVHDALPERNRPGHLPDHVADDRHDRRLHGIHPRAIHDVGHVCNGTLYVRSAFWSAVRRT